MHVSARKRPEHQECACERCSHFGEMPIVENTSAQENPPKTDDTSTSKRAAKKKSNTRPQRTRYRG
jgi:hypothetical protein